MRRWTTERSRRSPRAETRPGGRAPASSTAADRGARLPRCRRVRRLRARARSSRCSRSASARAFWGRAALLAGPVALAAALALSALEIARPRTVGPGAARCRRPRGAAALAAVTRPRLALAAALLAIFAVYAVVLALSPETSSLAAIGPHPDGGVRFYGISNQVETLLLVPALLGAALLGVAPRPAGRATRPGRRRRERPGADGGGVLVFAAGFLFLWLRLRGVALTARNARARGRGGVVVGLAPRRPRRGARRLEPRHRSLGDGPGALAGELAHRWRVSLDGFVSTWHATVIITASLARARLDRHCDGRARPSVDAMLVALAVLAARQRLPAGRRWLRRTLVRGAPILADSTRRVDSRTRAPRSADRLLRGSSWPAAAGRRRSQPTGPGRGHAPDRPRKANPAAGKTVFADNGCGGCHTFAGSRDERHDRAEPRRGPQGQGRRVRRGVDHRPERRDRLRLRAEHHAPGLRLAADVAAATPISSPSSSRQVIDLKAARAEPDAFRAAVARKGAGDAFDRLLEADALWRELDPAGRRASRAAEDPGQADARAGRGAEAGQGGAATARGGARRRRVDARRAAAAGAEPAARVGSGRRARRTRRERSSASVGDRRSWPRRRSTSSSAASTWSAPLASRVRASATSSATRRSCRSPSIAGRSTGPSPQASRRCCRPCSSARRRCTAPASSRPRRTSTTRSARTAST